MVMLYTVFISSLKALGFGFLPKVTVQDLPRAS